MKIKINPLFFVSLIICCVFGSPFYFFIAYISLIMHELIHLFFLYREKVEVKYITFEPFGISIKTKVFGKTAPFVFLSAPLFNIFIAFLIYLVYKKTGNRLFLDFCASNFALGFFNLLPILPFDGGRVVMNLIKRKIIFVFFSGCCGFFILLLGIIFIKSLNFNFSLIMIGIFITANSFSEKEQLFEATAEISKNRLTRKVTGKIPTLFLTVPEDYGAHKLISELDSKYFYMINVIKNKIVIGTVSEAELIEGVLNGKKFLGDFV